MAPSRRRRFLNGWGSGASGPSGSRAEPWSFFLLAFLLLAAPLQAAPPPGAEPSPENKQWFLDLRSREGWACCDISHCRRAVVLPNDDGRVFAFIDKQSFGPDAPDAWREVPVHELRSRGNRPPGIRGAIVCYADNRVVCVDLEAQT